MVALRPRRFLAPTPVNPFAPPALLGELVQTDGASATTRTVTVPAGGYPVGTRLVLLAQGVNATFTGVTDARGNSWTVAATTGVGSNMVVHYTTAVTTQLQAGDLITVSTSNAQTCAVDLLAFANVSTAGDAVDDTDTNGAFASTTTPTAGTVDTTTAYALVIAAWVFGSGSPGTFTPGAGWTAITGTSLSASRYLRGQWRSFPTAGSVTPAATIQTARGSAFATVAYKAA